MSTQVWKLVHYQNHNIFIINRFPNLDRSRKKNHSDKRFPENFTFKFKICLENDLKNYYPICLIRLKSYSSDGVFGQKSSQRNPSSLFYSCQRRNDKNLLSANHPNKGRFKFYQKSNERPFKQCDATCCNCASRFEIIFENFEK